MTNDRANIRWYYGTPEHPRGPISFADLCVLATSGALGNQQLIRRSEDDKWVLPSSVPELAAIVGQRLTVRGLPELFDTLSFAASLPSPATGTFEIPGYEITGTLGRGGMGVVLQATQLELKRTVALKLMLGAHSGLVDERARFQREAESVAKLEHENIVRIYDVGAYAGQPFICLEFMPGGSLATKLKGRPLSALDAARTILIIAKAIAFAHSRGIVHRDLKPSNILLTLDEEPKIADFGLAKQLDDATDRTHSGSIMGTPQYMAPEQAMGDVAAIGPSADIWALGALLYELLTGRPPFQASSTLETLEQVRTQEPVSPRRLQPKTPLDLETICLTCLQKSPARRFSSAVALVADLERFLDGRPIMARRTGWAERCWKWAKRKPQVASLLAILSIALVSLAGVVVWSNFHLQAMNASLTTQRNLARQQETRAVQGESKARDAQAEAVARELEARKYSFASGTTLAFQHFGEGDVQHALKHLRKQIPLPGQQDLRGFEWGCLWQLCHGDREALQGHGSEINCVEYSLDGKVLASGSDDHTIRLWDGTTHQLLHVLRGHTSRVGRMAFSNDGKLLASCSYSTYSGTNDKTVRLWDVASGTLLKQIEADNQSVRCLAFSSDGQWLAGGCGDTQIRVWRVETGATAYKLDGTTNWPSGVAFFKEDTHLVSAGFDARLRLWDLQQKKQVGELLGHTHTIHALDLSADGKLAVTGSTDGSVRVWSLEQQKEIARFEGGSDAPKLSFSPDGKRIAIGGRSVTILDVASQKIEKRLRGHSGYVHAVDFSPDGDTIASGGYDGVLRLWDAKAPAANVVGHSQAVWSAAFSPDNEWVATASTDHTVQIWHASTGRHLHTLTDHEETVYDVEFSPDGRLLATAGYDKHVKLWDTATWKRKFNIKLDGDVLAVTFNPTSKQLAMGVGSTCVLFDIPEETTTITTLEHLKTPHQGTIVGLAYAPDGQKLATGATDKKVCLFDLKTKEKPIVCEGHTDYVHSVAFRQDGKALASGSADRSVRIWHVASGLEDIVLKTNGKVRGVSWHPDEERLAVAMVGNSYEPSLAIWNVSAKKLVKEFNTHRFAYSVAYSKDGETILTAVSGNLAELWNSENPELQVAYAAQQGVWATAISPQQDLLAVGETGVVRVLSLPNLEEKYRITDLRWKVRGLSFSPDGSQILVGESHWPNKLAAEPKIFDAKTGALVHQLPSQVYGVLAVAYSPDGKWIATAGARDAGVLGQVNVFDAKTFQPSRTLQGSERHIRTICFTPDSQVIIAGSADFYNNVPADVRAWDIETSKELFAVGSERGVFAIATSPNGRHIAVGGVDDAISVWDIYQKKLVTTLPGNTSYVRSLCYLDRESRLAAGNQDGNLRFWDLDTQQQVGQLTASSQPLETLSYSPKYRMLLTGAADDSGQGQLKEFRADDRKGASGPTLGIILEWFEDRGVTIKSTIPDAFQPTTKLKVGDVIVKVGDIQIQEPADVATALIDRHPGEVIAVDLLRGGRAYRENVTIGSR